MPSGRLPDLKRREQIVKLRAAGLTLAQIGKRLGVTRQRVQKAISLSGNLRIVPIKCRECGKVITRLRLVANNNFPVHCVDCLPRDATFSQRLKTRRLSAGLTLAALEKRCGVGRMLLSSYKCGRSEPAWQTIAKLIRVLGLEWLAVE